MASGSGTSTRKKAGADPGSGGRSQLWNADGSTNRATTDPAGVAVTIWTFRGKNTPPSDQVVWLP